MRSTIVQADRLSSTASASRLFPEPISPAQPDRHPIRHLLIGTPDAVQITIHRLHNLGYAEAILWSPAIALPDASVTLTLSAGEVMRVLTRYVRLQE